MDNLFDIVKEKTFSVFSSKDRRTNYDLLMTIYDLFYDKERKQYINKEDVVDDLVGYIRGRKFETFNDEEGENIANKDAKFMANAKLRQFKKAGWIEEETGAGFEILVSLNSSAIQLLETFRSIVLNNNKPLEYTGYFYTIYGLLKNFEYKQSKAIIEQVVKNTRELFSSLQGLNSKIKSFIENLLKTENMTPQEILDLLLRKYQNQIILTVFNNLKGKDNPSKFTSDILEHLREIRYINLDQVVENYLKTNSLESTTSDVYIEGEKEICNLLDEVISRFETVNEFISVIDNKNAKFHSSALSKLEFLLNSRTDVDGLVIKGLRLLKDIGEEAKFEDIISLESDSIIDDKSIYQRAFNKEKVTFVETVNVEVDESELQEKFDFLLMQDDNSKKDVNEFVLSKMKQNKSIRLEQIEINNNEEFFMLILIQVYSVYEDMVYDINFFEEKIIKNGYNMKVFELVRRTL